MKKLISVLLVAVLGCLGKAAGEETRFIRLNSDFGLQDNSIRACIQDSYGFLWLSTREGISMYDGQRFKALEDESCDILGGLSFSLLEDNDRRLWFVTNKGFGYHNLETGETCTVHQIKDGSMRGARMALDRAGRVWFAAEEIYCWDPRSQELTSYEGKIPFHSMTLEADENGQMWFLSREGDLYRFFPQEDRFERIWKSPAAPVSSIWDIRPDFHGHMLFTGPNGWVYRANILTGAVEPYLETGRMEVRSIILRPDGSIWVGTDNGIVVFDGDERRYLVPSEEDAYSLPGEDVWVMFQDKQENVWVGLFYNGLCIHQSGGLVERFTSKSSGGSLSGNMVKALAMADDHSLLVGTEDGGLNCLNLSDGSVRDLSFRTPAGGRVNVHSVLPEGDNLWVATFGDGVFLLDEATGKVKKHYLPDVQAVLLYRTSQGEMLLGTTDGLFHYDSVADTFVPDTVCTHGFVQTLCEDSDHWLWVGTYGNGLWLIKDDKVQRVTTKDTQFGLTSDYITNISEDSTGRIWVCSEGGGVFFVGLDELHANTFHFRNLTRKNGFTSNVVSAMLEDPARVLWFSSGQGIVKLDSELLGIREVFMIQNGGVANQFAYGSALLSPSGRIFFGTNDGLLSFSPSGNPHQINERVHITDIQTTRGDGTVTVKEEGKSVFRSEKIRIPFAGLSSLNLYFSATDFGSSRTRLYETKLRSRHNQVVNYTTRGEISYAALQPGKYNFQVRLMGAGNSPTRELEIYIVPPFWRSVWAIGLYVLLGWGLIVLLWFLWRRYREVKMQHQSEKREAEIQKEIYDAKINFFTNITHEIRTPLTLIKMPLDKIIARGDIPEKSREELLTMQSNAERLLNLTNQLLDIRKMEKNEVAPTFQHQDIGQLVKNSCKWFRGVSEDQHITLDQHVSDLPLMADYDPDMIGKILSNLLSNAIKYGGGHVEVWLEEVPEREMVRIRVNSDGPRIPKADEDKIFEKFYQVTQKGPVRGGGKGTGLGLPFALELARLHKGNLYLDKAVKDANSFVLELPVHQDKPISAVQVAENVSEPVEDAVEGFDNHRYVILVVEDDQEMRGYIARELSEQYNVVLAANGADALKQLEAHRIDLVVSDIMMPEMDGCELCNRIKSTSAYSHIPVILLTAAVGMETRIETLEAGADGYIEKPFSIELLHANIANLFKNREIANRQFVSSPLSHFSSVVTGEADREFMDKLHETIMSYLSDTDLNIETLTTEMGTSKSTLYRKVTANTGLNINEYIRVCRLKKAAELLSTRKYRISEVAYQTGFSSPSYFATCFQKQFNISPSAFMKSLQGGGRNGENPGA